MSASVAPIVPIVKWAGGKRKLAPLIVERLLDRTYGSLRLFEPFCGGAAVWLAARGHARFVGAILNDQCAPLMRCYQAVLDDANGVSDLLERLASTYMKADPAERAAHYHNARAILNASSSDWRLHAAMFLFVNRTCFNGLWRTNKDGAFNVPHGRVRRLSVPSRQHLRDFSDALAQTNLTNGPYGDVLPHAGCQDAVYLDPPYDVDKPAQFTKYSGAFDVAAQIRLASDAADACKRGARVVASNRGTQRMIDLYEGHGFTVEMVHVRHSIGATGDRRTYVGEILAYRGPG